MEQRGEYVITTQGDTTQPDQPEAVCACGHKFGKLVTKYRQDGAWITLYLYGLLPSPTWAYSTDCPVCGAEFRFYAHRRGKQAAFE